MAVHILVATASDSRAIVSQDDTTAMSSKNIYNSMRRWPQVPCSLLTVYGACVAFQIQAVQNELDEVNEMATS